MANFHWIFKLVVLGFVAAIDYGQHEALVGFVLAAYYFFASVYSLLRRDNVMFRRRAVLFVLFLVEVYAISSIVNHPPDLGFLDRWVHKLAK